MAARKADRKKPLVHRGASVVGVVRARNQKALEQLRGNQWPVTRWQKDPVGFVREVLGEEPMPNQESFLQEVAGNASARVAVRSGQKTGKTKTVVWLALWFFCSFEDAHVHMTATTKVQVQNVLWGELGKTIRKAKARGFEIEAPAANAETGLVSADGSRVIRGFTVRDVEAASGLSGEMLFIVDEASALPEKVWQAIEGNTIGVARIVMISNPTRTEGPFFDAFHREGFKKYWSHFHFDSEAIAQWAASQGISHRGVADLSTIERWAELYGRDSVFFLMRVKGDFIVNETGKVFGVGAISTSQESWDESEDSGNLSVGVDPAGPGSGGDEWAFAIVRGRKLLALFTFRGLSEDAGLEHVRGFLATYRRGDEIPNVIVDSEGSIGAAFYGRLKAIEANLERKRPDLSFKCWGVKSSGPARRQPNLYDKLRDELWANLAKWMKDGGAILRDHELERQLNAVSWLGTNGEKLKATPKEGPGGLREKLGRSPDHADAVCLAVWNPEGGWIKEAKSDASDDEDDAWGAKPARLDPYGERDDGGSDRPFDPYAR